MALKPVNIDSKGLLSFFHSRDDHLIILDELSHEIKKISSQGEIIWSRDNCFEIPICYPTDVTGNEQSIWFTDRYNHRVCQLDHDGHEIRSFGEYGVHDQQFFEPFAISLINDQLFIGDSMNQKIKVWSVSGEFQFSFGLPGPGLEYYNANFFQDQSIVKNWQGGETRFSTNETKFFSAGFFVGEIDQPKGISFLDDQVIVNDFSGRIQFYKNNGEFIRSVFPIKYCEWISTYKESIFYTQTFSKKIHQLMDNGENKIYYESSHEIGKFKIIDDHKLIYIDPLTSTLYMFDNNS